MIAINNKGGIQTNQYVRVMLNFLPSTANGYIVSIDYNDEILETVIIEDVFMPELIKLLNDNKDEKLLSSIFDYFERVSNSGDDHLVNMFSITALEILGNDKKILSIAQKYMGAKTKTLQREADRKIGRGFCNICQKH